MDDISSGHAQVVGTSTENEACGTLSNVEAKVSEAVAPLPSPTLVLTATDAAGPARREKSAVGKRPNPASPEQPPTHLNFSAFCQWLAGRWRAIEKDHFTCACDIFHTVRNLQTVVIQQVKECSQSYGQLAISHQIHFTDTLYKWQEGFNAVEWHKRTRSQYKEMLHARTTELAKLLMDEINKKLNTERSLNDDIMRSGWLDETISAIYNSFVALMQLELDTYVDALSILRDYISVVEFRLLGVQVTAAVTIPFVELLPLDDGRRTARSLTPIGSEGRKGKGTAQEHEKEKEKSKTEQGQQPVTTYRPLTQEAITPWFVPRKILVGDVTARLEQGATKKPPPARADRRSQGAVDAGPLTRKHSKVQASSPQPREDIEEFMLKDVLEKAKEAVTKLQDSEQEARRNRYNVRVPEEATVVHPGAKKAPAAVAAAGKGAAAAKGQLAPPVSADAGPSITFSGHETAINQETAHVLSRLEGIVAYGAAIIAEIRKVAKTLDTKIVQSVDDNCRKELASAAMLIEYIKSQIENEEPIQQALVYLDHRFCLSCDQFVRIEEPARQEAAPRRSTFYDEYRKLSSPDGKVSYDDLQKAIILSVERSHGKDLVHKDWYSLDSDDLINAAHHTIIPDLDKLLPDGVNIADVQVQWNVALQALGNPPATDAGHSSWF
ncbi:hypothetical protein RvY_13952 [Ramazzottius varieornatus]|uniref:Uncharacterized protein n=1 Tax=Ramazzottius varieornatus TaxID=947166 RepID=A0A1D1VY64_RAMVA|nr:hypothetical protein RvY_13952 [Ramazzottius varieornatus]